jgi:hypothetical protein
MMRFHSCYLPVYFTRIYHYKDLNGRLSLRRMLYYDLFDVPRG